MKEKKSVKPNKKKIIILVSLVLLLVATGCLNYFLSVGNKGGEDPISGNEISFFNSFRGERESMRAQELLLLEDVISVGIEIDDSASVTAAQAKKLSMADAIETELMLEGLIKSKGYEDCIVTISAVNVNVIVLNDGELGIAQAAQIFDIITTQTNYLAKDIILIPYV